MFYRYNYTCLNSLENKLTSGSLPMEKSFVDGSSVARPELCIWLYSECLNSLLPQLSDTWLLIRYNLKIILPFIRCHMSMKTRFCSWSKINYWFTFWNFLYQNTLCNYGVYKFPDQHGFQFGVILVFLEPMRLSILPLIHFNYRSI